jgi:isoleucyl-tRNA synthetase
MAKALKDSLQLPRTEFPMRASLAQREPAWAAAWEAEALYQSVLGHRAGAPSFVLHDGPPYANGDIHLGHTLNKVLKDIVVRFQSMRGHRAPYVPGWDCHGLPIEQKILKELGDKIHEMEPLALRRLCHDYARGWIETQRTQFKRLGILGDWEHPYTTIDPSYEKGILEVLLSLVEKGLVRKGYRAVHWDPIFRTALAEAEIEYEEHTSPSIYVAMPLLEPASVPELAAAGIGELAIVIWTTTPWTMPANLGISLHPEFDYAVVRADDGRHFLVAAGLREKFEAECGLEGTSLVTTLKATNLERKLARHPIFPERTSLIMLGEHVTLEQGSGCVHTAPGHGADDFQIGAVYGLPVFCPVDARGCYTADYPEMEGVFVFDANPRIVDKLREAGLLLGHRKVRHDYPYSWRSKHPIIFRATEQWFVELADGPIREEALRAIDEAVEWIPHWGRDRIRGMVERRPEWCISRQRHWGVPIPAVRHLPTNRSLLDARVVRRFLEVVAVEGTDAWYARPVADFLPADWDAAEYERESDILDVWFDSGASHTAVLRQTDGLSYPADLYLEGSDQHRGWFQAALLLGIGAHGAAPFKAVLTHGFVLDGEGKAMSKSLGNVISPLDLIEQYGADILRLWVASIDYRNDVAMSEEILQTTADAYRTLRNSLRFQLGNLFDFRAATDAVPVEQLTSLDRWALHQLAELARAVSEAYGRYEFHRATQLLNQYFSVTLSARYHDILKDRLYTYRADHPARRSAQTVIHAHAVTLLRLLGPVLVFTADEAWGVLRREQGLEPTRLALGDWPEIPDAWSAQALAAEFEQLLTLRERVNEALEGLRGEKVIGKSIEAAVTLRAPATDSLFGLCQRFSEDLAELFIVSAVHLQHSETAADLEIVVTKAPGHRCPRCWRTVENLVTTSSGELCERCADALGEV